MSQRTSFFGGPVSTRHLSAAPAWDVALAQQQQEAIEAAQRQSAKAKPASAPALPPQAPPEDLGALRKRKRQQTRDFDFSDAPAVKRHPPAGAPAAHPKGPAKEHPLAAAEAAAIRASASHASQQRLVLPGQPARLQAPAGSSHTTPPRQQQQHAPQQPQAHQQKPASKFQAVSPPPQQQQQHAPQQPQTSQHQPSSRVQSPPPAQQQKTQQKLAGVPRGAVPPQLHKQAGADPTPAASPAIDFAAAFAQASKALPKPSARRGSPSAAKGKSPGARKRAAATRDAATTPQVGALTKRQIADQSMQQALLAHRMSKGGSKRAPASKNPHLIPRKGSQPKPQVPAAPMAAAPSQPAVAAAVPHKQALQQQQQHEQMVADADSASDAGSWLSDDETGDWRSAMRSITGYNAQRYREREAGWDDRSMEASWQQMQAEERRSAKLGRKADLEEETAEAARQAAKAARRGGRQ